MIKSSGKSIRNKDHWVGFDLGGTKMMACVFDHEFAIGARRRLKTKARIGVKAGLERIVNTIDEALDEADVKPRQLAGIGIGCPGPLDLDKGIMLETPNLGWRNAQVAAVVGKAFGCPVVIANDVDAGVYGEYRFGAAIGAHCVVGVFPGTGIGGGCVYQGSIIRGKVGSCMEIGHIPLTPDGPLCGCGQRGCLETYAGRLAVAANCATAAYRGDAPNLLRDAGTDISNIRSGAIARAIRDGDTAVEQIVRESARLIGWAMAGVVNMLAPDMVLLGGGMVDEMPKIFKSEVDTALRRRVMPSMKKTFEVAAAKLGGDAGVTGIAAWARKTIEDE